MAAGLIREPYFAHYDAKSCLYGKKSGRMNDKEFDEVDQAVSKEADLVIKNSLKKQKKCSAKR